MKWNKLDEDLEPTHKLQILYYLRKNSIDGKYVTQEDIMKALRLVRSHVSSILKILRKKKLILIKMTQNTKNTGPRKRYKLTKKGEKIVDTMVTRALGNDEIKLLDFYKETYKPGNNEIQRDFWEVISLFHKYCFNDNSSEFSQLIQNFVKSVKKFFKYEEFYNQPVDLPENIIKNIDK